MFMLQCLHVYNFVEISWQIDPFNQTIRFPQKGQFIVIFNWASQTNIIIEQHYVQYNTFGIYYENANG